MRAQELDTQDMIQGVQGHLRTSKPGDSKSVMPIFKKALEGELNKRELQNLLIGCEMVSLLMEKTQIVHFSGLAENVIKRMYMTLTGSSAPTGRPASVVRLLENPETCIAGTVALRYYLTHNQSDNTARMSDAGELDIEVFLKSYKIARGSTPRDKFIPANLALHIIKEYTHRNVMLERCQRCGFVYAFHCEKINTSCPCCPPPKTGKQGRITGKRKARLQG
jgi:hypothetical protein